MKKLTIGFKGLLLVSLLAACGAPEQSDENQAHGTSVEQPADEQSAVPAGDDAQSEVDKTSEATINNDQSGAVETQAGETQKARPEGSQRQKQHISNDNGVGVTAAQVVDNAVERLSSKLNLDDQQAKSLNGILTEAFANSGQPQDGSYSMEESRNIGIALIKSSAESVKKVLNADQKEKLQRFLEK